MTLRHAEIATPAVDSTLKIREESLKIIWLPVVDGQTNLTEMSVQTETGGHGRHQNEKSVSEHSSKSVQQIFVEIADRLISKYSNCESPLNGKLQSNNANAAKADTKE
jgi:hypothetical protein